MRKLYTFLIDETKPVIDNSKDGVVSLDYTKGDATLWYMSDNKTNKYVAACFINIHTDKPQNDRGDREIFIKNANAVLDKYEKESTH